MAPTSERAEVKKFKCQVCKKRFARKAHSDARPFPCDMCHRAFKQNSALKAHKVKHSSADAEKPHKCSHCQYSCWRFGDLKKHLRIHSKEKPFPCQLCGKAFRQTSGLSRHQMTHTGDKPYECIFCSQSYKTQKNLNRHILVHIGEKWFPCDLCDARFVDKRELREHGPVHSDDGAFKCSKCPGKFRNAHQLEAHWRQAHSEDVGVTLPVPKRRPRSNVPAEVLPSISNMCGYQQTTSTASPTVTVVLGNALTTEEPPSSSRVTDKECKADEPKTPDASPVATGQQNELAPFQTMSTASLNTLLTAASPNNYQVTNRQFILVDTRDSASFNQCHVKLDRVSRFPINPNAAVVQSQEFDSKGAVVKYILENETDLLGFLQAPGFYDCIVVMGDDCSTSTSKLRSLMNALAKWNENTRTDIYLLECGVQAFCNQYHNQLVSGTTAPTALATSSTISSSEDCLKNLDAMIVTSKVLVTLASRLKSLASVLSILEESELEILRGRVFPKALLCPTCLKFPSGEILLCDKGHSVCSVCYYRKVLKTCDQPQCGAPISGNSRNYSLEQMLAMGTTLPCVCHQNVKLGEIEAHFEECVRKGEEFVKIQEMASEIRRKLREENGKLCEMKKLMLDYELIYAPTLFQTVFPEGMGAVQWNRFVDRFVAKERTVAALREELVSLTVGITTT